MKVLDVSDLQKGGEETIHTLESLRNSVQQVKVSIKAIIDLEDSLRGEGGEAIRVFYKEAHLPFLSYLEQFLSQYEDTIRKMMASLNELEPDAEGLIREDFLEQEVEAGLHKASTVTMEIVQEVNQVVNGVQDIVSLPSVDDSAFLQDIQQARNKKDETVERLHEFDQTESSQLAELKQSLSTMNQYIESISSQFETGDMSIGSYQAGQIQSNADWASINLAVSAKFVPPGEVDEFISEQKRLSPVSLGYEFTSGGVCTREDIMAASAEDVGWFKKTASFVLDFIPIVGNVKAAIETKTGENLITGVEYEGWERAILAASVVGGGAVKVFGKGVKGVSSVAKGAGKSNGVINSTSVKKVKEIDLGAHIIKGKNGKKQLLPNTKYITNGNYTYNTDDLGRIVNVEAPELVLKKADRNKYAQVNVGGKDRLPDDDGGHLVGAQFNGSPDIDNLVPQNSQINRRGGVWYEMETEWANAMKEIPPKKVSVGIEPIYSKKSMRPDSFMVEYEIEGEFPVVREIANKSGG
ncbi:T7SS effector LXG polymorphic toxin [Halobacillus ihumii]|uniref:T7SS effector LXG polymorphic toxin n=1 Tax=Halobacillus ihumii TaxID=2686092 RepID=UPI001966F039|nr:T7SS effector LXG polymorphic toxin [Halobacillus ihumii]